MAGPHRNVVTRYDIELVSSGTKPIRVARTIATFTNLGKKRAWELLRNAPVVAIQGASRWTAEEARQQLERRGATVKVRAYDVEVPNPEFSSPALLRGTTESPAAGTNRAALLCAASLVATLLPLVTVQVVLNVDDLSDGMFGALLWLGIACTIAAIILGTNGRGATTPSSGLRALSTIAVVLGVVELIGMLAFTMFALALREAAGDWFQM